jgi:hypothetical protein
VFEFNTMQDLFIAAYPSSPAEAWEVRHLEGAVARDWGDAARVFRVQAFEAAVVMCGRTLEAAADKLGIEGRTLQSRITKMLDAGLITEDFRAAMDYVRLIRNVGAHAGDPVGQESADGTMRFTQQALRMLFEVPGELHRLTDRPEELDSDGEDTPPDDG